MNGEEPRAPIGEPQTVASKKDVASQKSAMDAIGSSGIWSKESRGGTLLCRRRSVASKGKRPSKAVSVLGIAGVSLAASTGGSPAEMPSASLAAPTAGSAADQLWQNTAALQVPTLDEEEISDVSLATFHLFDKDNLGSSQSGMQLAAFRGGGCGCGHGCGGGRGCGGFRGCGGGCRGCGGVRACGAAAEAAALAGAAAAWAGAAAAAAPGLGLGRRLLLVVGRLHLC